MTSRPTSPQNKRAFTADGYYRSGDAISSPFLAELETWAREISGQNNLAWLEKQLEECLPTFKMWRERKKSEENNQNQQVA